MVDDDLYSEEEKFAFKDELRGKSVEELQDLLDRLGDLLSDDHFEMNSRVRAVAEMRLVSNELELRKLGKP